MIFNSWAFLLLMLVVLPSYLFLPYLGRKVLLILAGLFFYGWWDERFLAMLLGSTLVNFFLGIQIESSSSDSFRKRWLIAGIFVNLLLIGIFKYSDFFLSSIGYEDLIPHLILPIGISFYTFQAISYLVEVHGRRFPATRDPFLFFLYKCYFPQLVAGPIERPGQLLPQLSQLPIATKVQLREGLWLIVWGFFLKLVVADNLGLIVDSAFSRRDYEGMTGFHVASAVLAFTFQIYGDFCGYSKIARGVSKLFGIELVENFNHPYFSKAPSEFWTRWHISLSSWLRDYLYIPLGGNRRGRGRTYLNLMLTMLLGGLWHGASWMFVIWGGFHGLLLVIDRVAPRIFRSRLVFFPFICFGWLIFRSENLNQLGTFVQLIFSNWQVPKLTLTGPYPENLAGINLFWIAIFSSSVLLLDWVEERRKVTFSWALLLLLAVVTIVFGGSSDTFIYFQF
jgi:alginate O-acetyltransferase complex protein AlgI